jgi:hypothetical protein
MSMTNEMRATRAAEACRDTLLGKQKYKLRPDKVSMSFEVTRPAPYGVTNHTNVIAYSYDCPMYRLYYNGRCEEFEILINTNLVSPTTSQHSRLYIQELRKLVDLDIVRAYYLDLGEYHSNGLTTRMDTITESQCHHRVARVMQHVQLAGHKGIHMSTVEDALTGGIRNIDEAIHILTDRVDESRSIKSRKEVVAEALSCRTLLHDILAIKPANRKTIIRAHGALAE